MVDLVQTDEVLRLICRQVTDRVPRRSEPVELGGEAAKLLLERVRSERVVPLLTNAVNEGLIVLPDDIVEKLVDLTTTIMSASVEMEATTVGIVAELEKDGFTIRVVKGLATAHLDYPNPALRQFGDVDLLIPAGEAADALGFLEGLGLSQRRVPLGNDWSLAHSIEIDAGGFEIDLHHRLLHQAAGHLAGRLDLFSMFDSFDVGGHSFRALPKPLRLLQAASQNILSEPSGRKLSSDVDVLRMSDAIEDATAWANDARLGWLLEMGIERAGQFGPLPAVASAARLDRRQELLRSVYSADERSPLRLAMAEAVVAPVGSTLRTALSALFPGPDYLARRGRSRRGQLRHQFEQAARWRR